MHAAVLWHVTCEWRYAGQLCPHHFEVDAAARRAPCQEPSAAARQDNPCIYHQTPQKSIAQLWKVFKSVFVDLH